jgi:drug/metabolite transporter (DMT)-like permease
VDKPDNTPHIPPLFVLMMGILATSTASTFIRLAQVSASSLTIAAYRLGLASIILALIAVTLYRHELRALNCKQLGWAFISGLFLAVHFAAWISSLEYTTVASSVVLVSTTPLWVALISLFILHESVSKWVWVGLGVALAGGIVVGLSDACQITAAGLACPSIKSFFGGQAFLGDGLALIGALMAAFYLLIGRRLREQMSLMVYIFLVYGMAAVVLISVAVINRSPMSGFPPITYLWFLALALIPQLLGHSSYNWALRYLSAAYVSVSTLAEPIGSTILAYLILAEVPSIPKLIGAALILTGIVLSSRAELRPKQSNQSPFTDGSRPYK